MDGLFVEFQPVFQRMYLVLQFLHAVQQVPDGFHAFQVDFHIVVPTDVLPRVRQLVPSNRFLRFNHGYFQQSALRNAYRKDVSMRVVGQQSLTVMYSVVTGMRVAL